MSSPHMTRMFGRFEFRCFVARCLGASCLSLPCHFSGVGVALRRSGRHGDRWIVNTTSQSFFTLATRNPWAGGGREGFAVLFRVGEFPPGIIVVHQQFERGAAAIFRIAHHRDVAGAPDIASHECWPRTHGEVDRWRLAFTVVPHVRSSRVYVSTVRPPRSSKRMSR